MMTEIFRILRLNNLIRYLQKNYAFFAKYYRYLVLRKNSKKDSILVYTMGKVGSATVTDSLNNQLKDYFVYHLHWLSKNNLKQDQKFHKTFYSKNKEDRIAVNILPDYIIDGFYINKKMNDVDKFRNRYKIVTLTRDPVATVVSSFFQNLTRFFGYDVRKKLEKLDLEPVVSEIMDLFVNEFIVKNKVNFLDSDPTTWFDEELKEVFKFDVYSRKFPREQGYEIYNDKISVLLIRLENLNRCFAEASEKFFGEKLSIIQLKNVGDKKEYATVYNKFKAEINIPDWYLNKMYNSKYAKHFYTENEILSFKYKWLKDY